jgi:hypothetical protein
MAGINYTEMAAVAQELIDDNGRTVTLIRHKQAPADANVPWEGPDDPRTVPDATDDVIGCFVPISGSGLAKETIDEDALKRTQDVCLIGPGASFDLATADELIDGTVHKKITFVQTLKPATIVLMYFVGVER